MQAKAVVIRCDYFLHGACEGCTGCSKVYDDIVKRGNYQDGQGQLDMPIAPPRQVPTEAGWSCGNSLHMRSCTGYSARIEGIPVIVLAHVDVVVETMVSFRVWAIVCPFVV